LDSRDPIEAAIERGMRRPFVEPDFTDHPYGKMLEVWKSENTDDVKDALQAYSGFNTFESLRQRNQIKHDFSLHKDLWLIPYDVAAINMRRRALGLDWVEIDDPRMDDLYTEWDELPFVRDDVTWPIYLKTCAAMGFQPY